MNGEIEIRLENGRVFSGTVVDIQVATRYDYETLPGFGGSPSYQVPTYEELTAKVLNSQVSNHADKKSPGKVAARPLSELPNTRAIKLD